MGQKDKFEFSLDDLELEPLEESLDSASDVSSQSASSGEVGKAKFNIDKRSNEDRRESGDRRASIRFEEERRKGLDRRSSSANWDTL